MAPSVTIGGGLEFTVACEKRYHKDIYKQKNVGIYIVDDNLAGAVNRIVGQLGDGRKIEILRFFGHGAPGHQQVGDGGGYGRRLKFDPATGQVLGLKTLGALRGRFAENAWIELRGCSVGYGILGQTLLRLMASNLGVDVAAAATDQTSEKDPIEWENSVSFCSPLGIITRVPVGKQGFSLFGRYHSWGSTTQ